MGEINKFDRTNEFGQIYESICREKCVSPLSTIRARLTENRLRFCCDRVNYENWSPILNALAADRSLVEIHAYSEKRTKNICETIDTEEALDEYRLRKTSSRVPIFHTNYLLRCFVDAVAVCARDSDVLTSLALDGIPLGRGKYLDVLCSGLSFNRNLKKISLARCGIGDSGCNLLLLRAFPKNPNLRLIDLTSCSLTSKSARFIASFLKKRRVKIAENAGYKDTSSQRGVDTLILNENRKFGDEGLRSLADTLKDDFWLKSLGLRRCGLTRTSADAIIDLLETNSVAINFTDNELPVEIFRATRRLLEGRPRKGERISPRRRLADRRNDLGSLGETVRNQRRKTNRPITRERRKNHGTRVVNDKIPKLTELNDRLSNLIDRNRKLKRGLSNERRLLVGEKRLRISAERSYELMTPVIDKLRCGYQKQNRIRSRVLLENHLCSDIRKIFRDLESISAINAKIRWNADVGGSNDKIIHTNDVIVDKFSIGQIDEKKRPFGEVQKRPHCPPRQRV